MAQTKADEMALKQKEISVAEFFEKNRHLLGFDNKRKALLMTVKEAVDNSLDAAEEAGMLPEVQIELIEMGNDRYRVIVEDNGPGIVKKQIPNIFAKLLYGSKFHRLRQSRGQQGLGISASVMYGQLTTGRPAKITSKIGKDHPAQYFELNIDTQKNEPRILKEEIVEWNKDHGTRVEIDLEGTYSKGPQSVDEYLKETAIVNPHVTIIYTNPKAEQIIFTRVTDQLPKNPEEIKPHPHGIELGMLQRMLKITESRTLQSFLTSDFSRVGPGTAKEICQKASVLPNKKPSEVDLQESEKIIKAIKEAKIVSPSTDCLSPITSELLEKGLKKEIKAEFYTAVTRPPEVYRGRPFIIEVAISYGGELPADKTINIMRFANRVPLLYQQGACACAEAIEKTNWRSYGLQQSQNSLPVGPCVIVVHLASVWAPFTSEAKEAIAHYSEIIKEIKLAIQECGRKLSSYINKKKRVQDEFKKRGYIEKYLPHIGIALKELLNLSEKDEKKMLEILEETLEKSRPTADLEKVEHDDDEEGHGLELGEEPENEE